LQINCHSVNLQVTSRRMPENDKKVVPPQSNSDAMFWDRMYTRLLWQLVDQGDVDFSSVEILAYVTKTADFYLQ